MSKWVGDTTRFVVVLVLMLMLSWLLSFSLPGAGVKREFRLDSWVLYHQIKDYQVPPQALPSEDPEPSRPELPVMYETVPDFSNIADVPEKKAAFVNFLLPLIQQENEQILVARQRLLVLAANWPQIDEEDLYWLESMAETYRATGDGEALLQSLLRRVDLIPPSLALAQSANESGWGGSRFSQEGNNLFGQWCFAEGCGLIPASRPQGASYEVKFFQTPAASVADYMLNLNRHSAYSDLRNLRQQARQSQQRITGIDLAAGLMSYSARGQDYVDELRAMIRFNEFDQYD